MPAFQDHYRTLGVHRQAEPAVIEAAYRALVRQYHPDLNSGSHAAEERLKRINAAYAILANPGARRSYDQEWDAHNEPPRAPQSTTHKQPPPKAPSAPRPSSQASHDATPRQKPWAIYILGGVILFLVLRAVGAAPTGTEPNSPAQPTRKPSAPPTETAAPITRIPPTATAAPPTRTPPTETVTWGFDEVFNRAAAFDAEETELTSAYLTDAGLVLLIKAPGGFAGYVFDAMPSEGRDIAFQMGIAATDGWGELSLILEGADGGPQWTFGVDPVAEQWFLYRTSDATEEFFYWVEPRPYTAIAAGPLRNVEVRVVERRPSLWINGKNVVAPFDIDMPEVPGSVSVGFGAGINPESLTGRGDAFSVTFSKAELRAI